MLPEGLSAGLLGFRRRAWELVGRELRTFDGFLSCLTPFVYLARLHRRIMEKGAPLDGPLASGTGTVE